MPANVRRKIRRTGFILSVICLVASAIMVTQNPPGTPGRTAVILTGVTALLTGLSLLLQLRQKEP